MVITPEAEELLMNYGIIQAAMMYDASDIHICPGNPPIARINGRLNNIGSNPLSSENVEALVRVLTDRYKMSEFFGENPQDIDYTMEIPSLKRRFRINVFRQHYGPSIVMRILSNEVKNFQELGLPKKLEEISLERSGFFLVTGGTGSGKSRTLCAMLETINERVEKHIITIEDPIEIVFRNKMALIEQREVGTHVQDFHIALRSSLRETPDVILVGEIRDEETAQMTLKAAQVGVLVLATLHSRSASETISRFLSLFSDEHRGGARLQIADSFIGTICQQLILTKEKDRRVVAYELLLGTTAVRHLVRQDRMHLLHSAMEIASSDGMVTMEASLVRLGEQGLITWEEAFAHCNDKEAFLALLPPHLRSQFTIEWETEMDIKQLEQLKATRARISGSDVYHAPGKGEGGAKPQETKRTTQPLDTSRGGNPPPQNWG